jgi:hypothetical protein
MKASPQLVPGRMTADAFIAWAIGHDVHAERVEGKVHGMAPERHAQAKGHAYRAFGADGAIAARSLHEGRLAFDPPGLTLDVASLFGPA